MSGHSKWAKLKHTKGKTDAQKARLLASSCALLPSRLKNPRVTATRPACVLPLKKQKRPTCPPRQHRARTQQSIQRRCRDGAGYLRSLQPAAHACHGYTDNRNRTVQEIKHLLSSTAARLPTPARLCGRLLKEPTANLKRRVPIELSDEDAQKMAELSDALEDQDDVSEVYTNAA